MPSESVTAEFISLIKDTREHLAYLHELGVTNVETELKASSLTNKLSETKAIHAQSLSGPAGISQPNLSSSPGPTIVGRALHTERPLASATSLAQDSLFGEISVPAPVLEKSSETFEQIWSDVGNCTRCPLHQLPPDCT